MEEFSSEEKDLLKPFFTNLDKPVFVLKNLPEVVKGALFSRYSRTAKSLRRVLLEEFIKTPEMGFKEIVGHQAERGVDEVVAIKKAEEFYDRVLVGYGDDSVAELAGAHIACENVSNIASKLLEDPRLGISPLEKSTRYVYFNEKIDGKYRYYSEPTIMAGKHADLYVGTCDLLFDTYSRLIDELSKFVVERFPQEEGVSDRAYKSTVRAKVCDVLRGFLPAGTLTNLGMFGNGRSFEYLLTKMSADDLREPRDLAGSMHAELAQVIPSFVKRVNDKYGLQQQEYWKAIRRQMSEIAKTLPKQPVGGEEVELVDFDEKAEERVVAGMLYAYSAVSMKELRKKVRELGVEERKKIISAYMGQRSNRRNRPGRALEYAYYTFDLLGNYGMYRDLQRHRVLTQIRQTLSTRNGFDTPKELGEAGFEGEFKECMAKASEAFEAISKTMPLEAQYVVPMAYRVRWSVSLNMREAFHLIELRSMQQGHPDYRRMVQKMFKEVQRVHPGFAGFMNFVDLRDYPLLERLESEKKLDKKLEEMNKKYGPKAGA